MIGREAEFEQQRGRRARKDEAGQRQPGGRALPLLAERDQSGERREAARPERERNISRRVQIEEMARPAYRGRDDSQGEAARQP